MFSELILNFQVKDLEGKKMEAENEAKTAAGKVRTNS